MKQRLDRALVARKLVPTRSQAESWIRMGRVTVDGNPIKKPGFFVAEHQSVTLDSPEQYVSRAGMKLASVAQKLGLDFRGKIVLDVGSSTGGFTDYALQHGALKVYAVDVGTEQMHPSLKGDQRVELHEKTDIRDFMPSTSPDIVVVDVSFISVREILAHIANISSPQTQIIVMLKPQFEAGKSQVSKGVIKNDSVRREVLRDFEKWAKSYFFINDKSDSDVAGMRGNRERFYVIKSLVK